MPCLPAAAFVPCPACSGPAVREALSKDRKKDSGGGEDQWLLKPTNAWGLEGAEGGCMAVFDGRREVAGRSKRPDVRSVASAAWLLQGLLVSPLPTAWCTWLLPCHLPCHSPRLSQGRRCSAPLACLTGTAVARWQPLPPIICSRQSWLRWMRHPSLCRCAVPSAWFLG